MLLYHGSGVENIAIRQDGKNLAYPFGALFFTANYRLASDYGCFVYQTEIDMSDIFTSEDATGDALLAVMAERGISEENFDFCRQAVVEEDMDYQEQEEWLELTGLDDGDSRWEAQSMRIALARQLGFHGCGMHDECGSIAILPEYIDLSPAVDPDTEDDEDA